MANACPVGPSLKWMARGQTSGDVDMYCAHSGAKYSGTGATQIAAFRAVADTVASEHVTALTQLVDDLVDAEGRDTCENRARAAVDTELRRAIRTGELVVLHKGDDGNDATNTHVLAKLERGNALVVAGVSSVPIDGSHQKVSATTLQAANKFSRVTVDTLEATVTKGLLLGSNARTSRAQLQFDVLQQSAASIRLHTTNAGARKRSAADMGLDPLNPTGGVAKRWERDTADMSDAVHIADCKAVVDTFGVGMCGAGFESLHTIYALRRDPTKAEGDETLPNNLIALQPTVPPSDKHLGTYVRKEGNVEISLSVIMRYPRPVAVFGENTATVTVDRSDTQQFETHWETATATAFHLFRYVGSFDGINKETDKSPTDVYDMVIGPPKEAWLSPPDMKPMLYRLNNVVKQDEGCANFYYSPASGAPTATDPTYRVSSAPALHLQLCNPYDSDHATKNATCQDGAPTTPFVACWVKIPFSSDDGITTESLQDAHFHASGETLSSQQARLCSSQAGLNDAAVRERLLTDHPYAHRRTPSDNAVAAAVTAGFESEMRRMHGRAFDDRFISDNTCYVLTQSKTQPADARGHVTHMGGVPHGWFVGHMPSVTADAIALTLGVISDLMGFGSI